VAFQTAPGKHKGNNLPTNTLIPQQTIPALTLHLTHSKEQKGGDVIKRTTTGAITKTISLNKYKIQKPISKTTSKTNTLSPTEGKKKKRVAPYHDRNNSRTEEHSIKNHTQQLKITFQNSSRGPNFIHRRDERGSIFNLEKLKM
jgi:hypothetical protein